MNGELALLVVLTSHGNAYLSDQEGTSPPALLGSNPAFKFVRSVEFVDQDDTVIASDPGQWFGSLHAAGAKRLWLVCFPTEGPFPAHVAEAFSGGVPRGIQIDYEETQELWMGQWKFGRGQRWNVRYTRVPLQHSVATDPPPLEMCEENLRQAIDAAKRLAEEADLPYWAGLFEEASALQQTFDGRSSFLPERGFSPRSHLVLEVASHAWVFGGMGSWNDLWFPDDQMQQRYEAVTASLYAAVIAGIVAATNAFGREECCT